MPRKWPFWQRTTRQTEAMAEADRRRDFAELFGTTKGARVMAHILNLSGMGSFSTQTDAGSLAVAEGKRRLALEIYEAAGFRRDALGEALAQDDLRAAKEEAQYANDTSTNTDSWRDTVADIHARAAAGDGGSNAARAGLRFSGIVDTDGDD